jgi:anti-sigma28 factor (negative regulator of flagellin synthesis)
MKIHETTAVSEVGRVASPETPVAPPRDRVTVDKSRQVDVAVTTAKASVAAARPGRLKDIEAQVRAGQYHPDPSRVADEILNDAEIEAKLQALLKR